MDRNMKAMKTNTELQLKSLFQKLNINEQQQERLFVLLNEQFINSTTTEEYFKEIESYLQQLATDKMDLHQIQNIVKEIIQILKKHFYIRKESIQQIQELKTKIIKLTAENELMS